MILILSAGSFHDKRNKGLIAIKTADINIIFITTTTIMTGINGDFFSETSHHRHLTLNIYGAGRKSK